MCLIIPKATTQTNFSCLFNILAADHFAKGNDTLITHNDSEAHPLFFHKLCETKKTAQISLFCVEIFKSI